MFHLTGPSITTETTDVSMSICSLNSSTVSQPEGDYVNVDQVTKYVATFDIKSPLDFDSLSRIRNQSSHKGLDSGN